MSNDERQLPDGWQQPPPPLPHYKPQRHDQPTVIYVQQQPQRESKSVLWGLVKVVAVAIGVVFIIALFMPATTSERHTTTNAATPTDETESIAGAKIMFHDGYKCLDATDNGCRVSPSDSESEDDVYIEGLSCYSGRSYKGPIAVNPDGDFSYKTVLGGHRRIPKYTLVAGYTDLKRILAKKQAKIDKQEKQQTDVIADSRAKADSQALAERLRAEADKAEAARIATINRRMQNATNGLPSFQYDLGMNYLNGTDGIDKNVLLASYWLGKAAAQGNPKAKEAVEKMVSQYK